VRFFRVATDIEDYVRQTLETGAAPRGFENAGRNAPATGKSRGAIWIVTRYEQKTLREGRVPHYLTFRKTKRAGRLPDARAMDWHGIAGLRRTFQEVFI